jgi:thiamine biosynthesis lipoprotein ApbE
VHITYDELQQIAKELKEKKQTRGAQQPKQVTANQAEAKNEVCAVTKEVFEFVDRVVCFSRLLSGSFGPTVLPCKVSEAARARKRQSQE